MHSQLFGLKMKVATRSRSSNQRMTRRYTSSTFNQFCEKSRIHRQLTASYTPQQSDDTSPKQKDDNIGGKNTDEKSKLLRAYSDEASQVDKKILVAATQKKKLAAITHPLLNAKEKVGCNNPPLVECRSCSHYKQVFGGKDSRCS